jgi:hypothetical protein
VVAFYMPLLERSFIRDFSLLCLKSAREVGGNVEKVRSWWLCRAALKMGIFLIATKLIKEHLKFILNYLPEKLEKEKVKFQLIKKFFNNARSF